MDEKNKIIDPTKAQFPSRGIGEYEEIPEGEDHRIPKGKCCNCGFEVYVEGSDLCSEKCHKEYVAYLNRC